jgi:predicted secreted protein
MKHLHLLFLMSALLLAQTVNVSAQTASASWSQTVSRNSVGRGKGVVLLPNGNVISAHAIDTGAANTDVQVVCNNGSTGLEAWNVIVNKGRSDDVNDIIVDPATGDVILALRASSTTTQLDWWVVRLNGA